MPRSVNIRNIGLENHINAWAAKHGTPDYTKWVHYMEHGDEWGDPVPISKLMELWKTSKNTILKWKLIYQEDKE